MDTFAIHWTHSVQPPKSFLLWQIGRGIIHFAFYLEINREIVPAQDGGFAISVSELHASMQVDGRYWIFTCGGCGCAGCVGLAPVEVIHIDSSVFWDDPTYLGASYEFDRAVYQEAVGSLAQQIEQLTQQYPAYEFVPTLW